VDQMVHHASGLLDCELRIGGQRIARPTTERLWSREGGVCFESAIRNPQSAMEWSSPVGRTSGQEFLSISAQVFHAREGRRALTSRPRTPPPLPPCYATVQPGLEEVAAEEIARDLGGEVKRTGRGLVVFRSGAIDDRLLSLRTTEDVFLLAWGTDQLSHRA